MPSRDPVEGEGVAKGTDDHPQIFGISRAFQNQPSLINMVVVTRRRDKTMTRSPNTHSLKYLHSITEYCLYCNVL